MKQTFSVNQVEIDFQGGLTDQFPEFMDIVRESVYGCGKAFKVVAAEMDMSASELSRKLANNPNDPVHFPLKMLPDLISATGDKRPIYWLIEFFLEDKNHRRERALDELTKLLPNIAQLIKDARSPA